MKLPWPVCRERDRTHIADQLPAYRCERRWRHRGWHRSHGVGRDGVSYVVQWRVR